jgi:hypothetical protein
MIENIGTMTLDELFASGRVSALTNAVEIAAGNGALKRGQLIGLKTGGTYGAIADGDAAYGILAEDIDATSAVKAPVYVSGHFNANKIIGYEAEVHKEELRELGIYVDAAIAY